MLLQASNASLASIATPSCPQPHAYASRSA
jgi:hypothetical protein